MGLDFPQFCRGAWPPLACARRSCDAVVADAASHWREGAARGGLGELMMILELHRQRLKVAAIARQLCVDRKTVPKYIARGLDPPSYGPRPPQQKSTDPFFPYLRERLGLSQASPGAAGLRERATSAATPR